MYVTWQNDRTYVKEIELPDQIRISDEYSLEKECGGVYRDTMLAFSHWELNCKL